MVGQNALIRFYVLHVAILPLFIVIFMGIHFWRIRKDGGLSGPHSAQSFVPVFQSAAESSLVIESEQEIQEISPVVATKTYGLMALVKESSPTVTSMGEPSEEETMTFPEVLVRALTCFFIVLLILVPLSWWVDAPLEELANPSKSPNPAKAPWYFVGLQELVSYSAIIGGVIVPALIALGLIVIPYVDRNPKGVGRWFAPERRLATTLFTVFVLTMVILIIIGAFLRGPSWRWIWPW